MPPNFISKLSFLRGVGNFDLVGIDLAAANLRVCHVKVSPKGKELVSASIRSVAGITDDEISKNLLSLTRDLKIQKPHYVLCVGTHLVITKNIEVPSTDPREISKIINLQAGRHTPYSREEVIVDYIPIGIYKQNYTKVLLLILNSSVIKKQFAILDKAGIKVERAVLAQEAIAAFSGKIFKFDPAAVMAMIHLDDLATDFSVVLRNKVVFLRNIPIGRQQLIADKEKASVKFLDEVKKSLDSYQAENIDKAPAMIFVTGALDGLDGLDSSLNEAAHIPVRTVPYQSALPTFFKALSETTRELSVLNAVAPLMVLGDCRTSLIPEEIKLKMALARRARDLMITAVLIFAILIQLFIIMMTRVYFKNDYLHKLNEKYRNLGSEVQKLEADAQKNSQVRVYLANRGASIRVLAELYKLAPLNLELNYVKFERDGKFTVRGTAESRATIFAFMDSMEKSQYFKEVKNRNTTKRQEGQRELTDFEINCLVDNKVSQ